MYKNNKIIAIIPARSGSKGLVDKNIKLLNNKPMIAYTIEAAIKSDVFDSVVVSTDSSQYACIAEKYGAEVPFIRPAYLSDDISSSKDVILHTLEKMEELGFEFDYFMMLQPTSPLRDEEDIRNAMELLLSKNANSIVSVCEEKHPPLWSNTLNENQSLDSFLRTDAIRRQDIDPFYRINGAIYLASVEYYKKYNDFYFDASYAYIMDEKKSIDIDGEIDFQFAELIISIQENK